jgi:transcriptional regulator with XRE-family HTH domain
MLVPQEDSFKPSVVRVLVRRRGMTLRAFAREVGVHPVTVNSWLSGFAHPSAKHLHRVNEVLGLPQAKNGEVG